MTDATDPSNDGLLHSEGDAYGRDVAKLAMTVKGKSRPRKRDEVRRLFEEHLAPRATGNPAQQIVVWCADATEAETSYLWEVYSDPAAMEANARAPWFGEYMAAVGPLLVGQPLSRRPSSSIVALATPRAATQPAPATDC